MKQNVIHVIHVIKAEYVIYVLVALFLSTNTNPFQQSINYAVAGQANSLDLSSRVADSSNSLIYKIISVLLAFGWTSRSISFLINSILLVSFACCLNILYSKLGFGKAFSMMLTLFSITTYTFPSAIAYDVQIFGPITNARITPILILLAILTLSSNQNQSKNLRILFVVTLCLWSHLVIGIFIAVFSSYTVLKSSSSKIHRTIQLFALTTVTSMFLIMQYLSGNTRNQSTLSVYDLGQAIKKPFCIHYTNVWNFLASQNSQRTLPAIFIFLVTAFFLNYIFSKLKSDYFAGKASTESQTIGVIRSFVLFSAVYSFILNMLLVKQTNLSAYALGSMPMRYIDAANIFAFPILMFVLKKFTNLDFLKITLGCLILGRIVNARALGFAVDENLIHFLILTSVVLLLISSKKAVDKISEIKIPLIINYALSALIISFVLVQILHESNKPSTNWKSINLLSKVSNFSESILLTAPEVRFPAGAFNSTELLTHAELQSVLYVPESAEYIKNLLNRYYSTNFNRYLNNYSCALVTSNDVKTIWSDRSEETWIQLAQLDKFKYVITPKDWNLQLQLVGSIQLVSNDESSRVKIFAP